MPSLIPCLTFGKMQVFSELQISKRRNIYEGLSEQLWLRNLGLKLLGAHLGKCLPPFPTDHMALPSPCHSHGDRTLFNNTSNKLYKSVLSSRTVCNVGNVLDLANNMVATSHRYIDTVHMTCG